GKAKRRAGVKCVIGGGGLPHAIFFGIIQEGYIKIVIAVFFIPFQQVVNHPLVLVIIHSRGPSVVVTTGTYYSLGRPIVIISDGLYAGLIGQPVIDSERKFYVSKYRRKQAVDFPFFFLTVGINEGVLCIFRIAGVPYQIPGFISQFSERCDDLHLAQIGSNGAFIPTGKLDIGSYL